MKWNKKTRAKKSPQNPKAKASPPRYCEASTDVSRDQRLRDAAQGWDDHRACVRPRVQPSSASISLMNRIIILETQRNCKLSLKPGKSSARRLEMATSHIGLKQSLVRRRKQKKFTACTACCQCDFFVKSFCLSS